MRKTAFLKQIFWLPNDAYNHFETFNISNLICRSRSTLSRFIYLIYAAQKLIYPMPRADIAFDLNWFLYGHINHGTIIRTGITGKKIPCYMRDSAYRWFIVKKAKIFWSYVKHSWILAGVTKCRILIGLWK